MLHELMKSQMDAVGFAVKLATMDWNALEEALIFVAHDLNPRALSPKLTGFVQAQRWFQNLTPVSVAP